MPDHDDSTRPVHVTARERAHPALRTLARACIALARLATGSSEPEQPQPSSAPPPVEGDHASSREGAHD
jgi:hypothetical protein